MRESDQVWATVSHALMLTSAPNQKEQCWWTFQEAADLFEICVPAVCDISEFTKQQVSAEMVVSTRNLKYSALVLQEFPPEFTVFMLLLLCVPLALPTDCSSAVAHRAQPCSGWGCKLCTSSSICCDHWWCTPHFLSPIPQAGQTISKYKIIKKHSDKMTPYFCLSFPCFRCVLTVVWSLNLPHNISLQTCHNIV